MLVSQTVIHYKLLELSISVGVKIHSYNEWDKLKQVVVGSALHANWPSNDPVFSKESEKTSWTATPVPSGPVPDWVIRDTERDLEKLCVVLEDFGVDVLRPNEMNFVAREGMYNYCPRDRLLIAGEKVVDPAMMYPCRDQEIEALDFIANSDAVTIGMPRDSGMTLDAANICRLGDTWLYLESPSGNKNAAKWLQEQFPEIDIQVVNFYSGVHIDSTIVPLNDHTVMLNAKRVTPENCPKVFDDWDKIWIDDCAARTFHHYPYASKWIGMNCLSVDSSTVIVDNLQKKIITLLEKKNFDVIPLELRHSRTLGGGFHCVTLDTWRQND